VLTDPRLHRTRQRLSLRQEYGEFILQRIEEFKDQLSREQLLALADEAVRELEVDAADQLVLTEVLVLEHVDRLIMKRLSLPNFKRWRERHLRLRRAQREPTHWGLARDAPLVDLAARLADGDVALVAGAGVAPAGLFLAAHDWPVVFIDGHLATVETTESRAAAESLGMRFQAYVVSLGDWFPPDVTPTLVVIDPAMLAELESDRRDRFLDTLRARTVSGGVHCIPPLRDRSRTALGADALEARYSDWRLVTSSAARASHWFVAARSA
jgi:hypothetical protein